MLNIIKPESNTIDPQLARTVMDTLWPWNGVPYPESFTVVCDHWVILNEGTPEEKVDYEQGPLAVVVMPNGAKVTLEQIDPYDRRSNGMEWRGGWDEYTGGNMDTRDFFGGIFSVVLMFLAHKYDESSL